MRRSWMQNCRPLRSRAFRIHSRMSMFHNPKYVPFFSFSPSTSPLSSFLSFYLSIFLSFYLSENGLRRAFRSYSKVSIKYVLLVFSSLPFTLFSLLFFERRVEEAFMKRSCSQYEVLLYHCQYLSSPLSFASFLFTD